MAIDSRDSRFSDADLIYYARNVWTPQLQDPDNPQCCPICFISYMRSLRMLPTGNQEPLTQLLTDEHDFFGACARMLAAPRCAADLMRLQFSLHRNASRCRNTTLHLGTPLPNNELRLLIIGLYTCLEGAIVWGPRPVKTSSAFAQRSRKGRWPIALDQLLPYGAQESVASYLFWCHTLIDSFAFAFLAKMLDIARPSVLPHILADPQRERFLQDLLRIMRTVSTSRPESFENTFDEHQVLVGGWLRDTGQAPLSAKISVQILRVINSGIDAVIVDAVQFYAGHERVVYDALVAVADAGILTDEDDRNGIAFMASSLHAFLRLETPLPACFQRFREFELATQRYYSSPGRFLYLMLSQTEIFRHCAGPDCKQVAAATGPDEPGKLQECARCRFLRYCSRGCQKADWKATTSARSAFTGGGRASHKALCPVLCKLWRAGASIDQDPDEFAAAYERAALEPGELETLLLWTGACEYIPEQVKTVILARFNDPAYYEPYYGAAANINTHDEV